MKYSLPFRFSRYLLLVLLAFTLFLFPACRASFDVISLTVSPPEVAAGTTTFVIARVHNSGNRAGIYDAVLVVNGREVDRQQVFLEAAANQTLTFPLLEDRVGTYQIAVGSQKAVLNVVQKVAPPPPPASAAPDVPEQFRPMYATLTSALDTYTTYAASLGDTKFPVIFGAELLPANSNRGPELLQPQVMAGVKLYLDRLQELGVQGVTIPIHYPIYTPDYPRNSEYVAFYKAVVQEIRRRGLKLDIESHVIFANTAFSPVQFNFSSLTFDQYKAGRRQVIQSVLNDLQPDYLNIGAEPDTEAKLSGYSELSDPLKYADYLNYLVNGLNKRGAKIAAGIGTWGNLAYARNFITNPNLDCLSLHIYPVVGDTLQKTVQLINLAGQYHKRVILDEAWLYKVDALAAADMASNADIFRRDVFSFWAPLDQHFLTAIVNLARVKNIEYVSPFWTSYFFAYLEYDSSNANLPYRDTLALLDRLAAQNISQDKFTPTGETYRQLIQANR